MGGGSEAPLAHARENRVPFPVRVLTHNIRYAATSLFKGEKSWPQRLPGLLNQFQHYSSWPFNPATTIICLQEVLHTQLQDIAIGLGSEWSHVGVGRDDGKVTGEHEPIFYRHSVWEKLHFETVWLSETPSRPGKGWDAASTRVCTCLVLRHRPDKHSDAKADNKSSSDRVFMFLNTHLDDQGDVARRKGAQLIVQFAKQWRHRFHVDHYLLAGDLNSEQCEKNGAWEVLNSKDSGFVDAKEMLNKQNPADKIGLPPFQYGNETTFTGFNGKGDGEDVKRIDFIHLGVETAGGISRAMLHCNIYSYAVLPNLFDDGIRISDHQAVVVDLLY